MPLPDNHHFEAALAGLSLQKPADEAQRLFLDFSGAAEGPFLGGSLSNFRSRMDSARSASQDMPNYTLLAPILRLMFGRRGPSSRTRSNRWDAEAPAGHVCSGICSAGCVRVVRFGSKADIASRPRHVRYSPQSRHWSARVPRPLCANSGHSGRTAVEAFSG
jgi:hypothetical protein